MIQTFAALTGMPSCCGPGTWDIALAFARLVGGVSLAFLVAWGALRLWREVRRG